jgi:hypothetical protein
MLLNINENFKPKSKSIISSCLSACAPGGFFVSSIVSFINAECKTEKDISLILIYSKDIDPTNILIEDGVDS